MVTILKKKITKFEKKKTGSLDLFFSRLKILMIKIHFSYRNSHFFALMEFAFPLANDFTLNFKKSSPAT